MARNEFMCDCNAVDAELVKRVLTKMPSEDLFSQLAYFYKIIGDNTRCKILFVLEQHEMCVCDLANVLSMTKSSISHQLSKMRACGVVKCRKEGKAVYYSLDDSHISEVFKMSMEHILHKRSKGELL